MILSTRHKPYNHLQSEARALGMRVADSIVLSPQNDPFYSGSPTDRLMAAWFARLWRRFSFPHGVHLRRVHYVLISQDEPVPLPSGKPYENTERCWSYLGQAGKHARYLGVVPAEAFDDRRNPDPVEFIPDDHDPAEIIVVAPDAISFDLPDFPDPPSLSVEGFEGEQRYHVEVWVEKSTMNDVLLPVCQRYAANLITGVGELSITSVCRLIQRVESSGKPARILYVSDFDPAGKSMPVAVARKVEFYNRDRGLDIQLHPIVLTEQQVAHYRLPRTPIKESERRKERFEERFGQGATELDALEALHPGELARIVRAEVDRYFDVTLDGRVSEARHDLRRHLNDIEVDVLASRYAAIEAVRNEYERLRAEFARQVRGIGERVNILWQSIADEMIDEAEGIDIDIPKARDGRERDDALFDAARDYWQQIAAYKSFQGKGAGR